MLQELSTKKDYCLFSPSIKKKLNWYIIYTSPRAEKVVFQELLKMNYEVFLPTVKTLRVWKNRQKKWIDQILFPSYIFINTSESELPTIKNVYKVVNYIQCGGKPSVVPIEEMECIKKMLKLNEEVSVETSFSEGERVRIIQGPLAGYHGILVKQKGKTRFGIRLNEINQTVFIDVCCSILEKL